MSAAFPSDCKALASAHYDKTVQLWMFGLVGSSSEGRIRSTSFSLLELASASSEINLPSTGHGRLSRWEEAGFGILGQDSTSVDRGSGRAIGGPLEGHSDDVGLVVFSLDGKTLAANSDDGTLCL